MVDGVLRCLLHRRRSLWWDGRRHTRHGAGRQLRHGGQGEGYNVTSVNGSANSYRSNGVDLEDTADTQDTTAAGGAYDIGWTTPGQWFNYTVDVATAGTYTVAFRLSSPYGITDALHIANPAGANLTGSVAVPNTGGYETWTTVDASITLPAGEQTLTVDQDSNGWNFHFMAFTLSAVSGGGSVGDQPFGGTPCGVPELSSRLLTCVS